ncbi:MAG: tRNA (guanosine(46)-N7)-methyltransferase TrmB [Bacteroidales bacterium]|nr:tRNA (guanosine(46)-N7)-methyltransferase TrmB [Bacteroidales bacterium]
METFQNVIQVSFREVMNKDHSLKGNWNKEFFKNENPITLELGCGKGEYTVGLAKKYPGRNFLGVDIKGARIWKGAKFALENVIENSGFIRTRIDFIDSFFSEHEIDEIWITFPDPQPKKTLKRLTSSRFLNRYRKFITDNGYINLKTDNRELYEYTCKLVKYNQYEVDFMTDDLYNSKYNNDILSVKTFYEEMWLEEGSNIHYIRFKLKKEKECEEPPEE